MFWKLFKSIIVTSKELWFTQPVTVFFFHKKIVLLEVIWSPWKSSTPFAFDSVKYFSLLETAGKVKVLHVITLFLSSTIGSGLITISYGVSKQKEPSIST